MISKSCVLCVQLLSLMKFESFKIKCAASTVGLEWRAVGIRFHTRPRQMDSAFRSKATTLFNPAYPKQ
jgi:hypothetical protein